MTAVNLDKAVKRHMGLDGLDLKPLLAEVMGPSVWLVPTMQGIQTSLTNVNVGQMTPSLTNLRGALTLGGLRGHADMTIQLVNNEPQMIIIIQPQSEWQLGDWFPSIADTVIGRLEGDRGKIVLSSFAHHHPGLNVQVAQGLTWIGIGLSLRSILTRTLGTEAVPLLSKFPPMEINNAVVSVELQNDQPSRAKIVGPIASWGPATVELSWDGSDVSLTGEIELGPDWRLSSINDQLQALDAFAILRPVLRFTNRSRDGSNGTPEIEPGMALIGELDLASNKLELIGQLVGATALPVRATLKEDWQTVQWEASFGTSLLDLGEAFRLSNPTLRIGLGPESVQFGCSLDVSIFSQKLPTFEATFVAQPPKISFQTQAAWIAPLGISALTIDSLAVDLGLGSGSSIGINGRLRLGESVTMAAAFAVLNQVPVALYASLTGSMSLGEIIKLLTGLDLPGGDIVTVSNLTVSMVAQPGGVTIGATTYPSGFAFKGNLDVLGFQAHVDSYFEPESARFRLSGSTNAVSIGSFLRITHAQDPNIGPFFHVDSTSGLNLAISGKIALLGVGSSFEGVLRQRDVYTLLALALPFANLDLSCTWNHISSFRGSGALSFGINETITLEKGGLVFGQLTLAVGMDVSVAVEISNSGANVGLNAKFDWMESQYDLGGFELGTNDLNDIRSSVIHQLNNSVFSLFGSLVSTADSWVAAVLNGVLTGYSDAAKVLSYFGLGPTDLIKDLIRLGLSPLEAAEELKKLGIGFSDIFNALIAADCDHNRIVATLVPLGANPTDLVDWMTKIGLNPKDIAGPLVGTGVAPEKVAEALVDILRPDDPSALLKISGIPSSVIDTFAKLPVPGNVNDNLEEIGDKIGHIFKN